MSCAKCNTTNANYMCSGCKRNLFCSVGCSMDHRRKCASAPSTIGVRVIDMPFGPDKLDALHLKIVEAHARRQLYFIDENQFYDRETLEERRMDREQDIEIVPEYDIAGTGRILTPLLRPYIFRLRQALSLRIQFPDRLELQKCMKDWLPVKVMGHGLQGSVYQVCDEFSCGWAAKITVADKESGELQFYQKASDLGVAPELRDGFFCDDAGVFVLITERYQENLLQAMYLRSKEWSLADWESIFQQVFQHIYTLLTEGHIFHRDTKVCNYLYNSPTDVKLADYGISKWVSETKNIPVMMQRQANLFMESLAKNYEFACAETYEPETDDYFGLRKANPNGTVLLAIEKVLRNKKNLKWGLEKGVSYVFFR